MKKRGRKPEGKVKICWSADFAYALGLLSSDGCLYKDGRHINVTSKEKEQLYNFRKALAVHVPLSVKRGGNGKNYYQVQFSDVLFYKFLISIGITPKKSKTIGDIKIPKRYYFDFLRGSFDGDGSFYSYFDKRWKSSFMFYLIFVSASKKHIQWIREQNKKTLGVIGHINNDGKHITYQLKYAKKEAVVIIRKMYYNSSTTHLRRKKIKIEKALSLENKLRK